MFSQKLNYKNKNLFFKKTFHLPTKKTDNMNTFNTQRRDEILSYKIQGQITLQNSEKHYTVRRRE